MRFCLICSLKGIIHDPVQFLHMAWCHHLSTNRNPYLPKWWTRYQRGLQSLFRKCWARAKNPCHLVLLQSQREAQLQPKMLNQHRLLNQWCQSKSSRTKSELCWISGILMDSQSTTWLTRYVSKILCLTNFPILLRLCVHHNCTWTLKCHSVIKSYWYNVKLKFNTIWHKIIT